MTEQKLLVSAGVKIALVVLASAQFRDESGITKLLVIVAIAAIISIFYRVALLFYSPLVGEEFDQCVLFYTKSVCTSKTPKCSELRKQMESDEEYAAYKELKCNGNDIAAIFARERLEQSYSKENYPLCDTQSLRSLLDDFRCPEKSPAFFIALAALFGAYLSINAKVLGSL
jgi:hypothetical protein